jgi:hypothetical protein
MARRGKPQLLPLERPRWLTSGTIRLGILGGFIVAIGMLPTRLSPDGAAALLVAGGIAVVAGAAAAYVATRRIAADLPVIGHSQRAAEAVLLLLRRTGLPLLGLTFFLFWTFVYLGVWWYRPEGAFDGLAESPRFADFFYYAVSSAFISPPNDVIAVSRGARTGTMIEMLTAFALLTAYLSSFVDWLEEEEEEREQGDREGREPVRRQPEAR